MGSRTRQRKLSLSRSDVASKDLRNAMTCERAMNYAAIFEGFESMGIKAAAILPRQAARSYRAWHALSRQVRKSEHGVKVVTRLDAKRTKAEVGAAQPSNATKPYRLPKTVTVFHASKADVFATAARVSV